MRAARATLHVHICDKWSEGKVWVALCRDNIRIYEILGAGEVTFGLRSGGWGGVKRGWMGKGEFLAKGTACAKSLGRKKLRSFLEAKVSGT